MLHHAKKRFGQNFLIDESIIHRIIDSINPQAEDNIIEIGPGLGALTKPLLQKVNELNVIELDKDVIPKLLYNCRSFGKPVIHEMDVLKFDFAAFHQKTNNQKALRVIGNLPYNISTPVLFLLLKNTFEPLNLTCRWNAPRVKSSDTIRSGGRPWMATGLPKYHR